MSSPRVPAFQPRLEGGENQGDVVQADGSRVDVLSKPVAPIYGDAGNNGNPQTGQDAEDQLARLLAGADSGQIRTWAGNISQNNARKAQEFFPNSSPLKYVGAYAVPATYQSLTLSEVNRRRFGAYVPWIENQGDDMTPLAGNRIIVAGDSFSLKNGIVDSPSEDAIPVEWQEQMDSEWRQVQINTGPAGGGTFNRQHLAMGRFSMSANPHQSNSTLLPS